jgi:hypothetical protein
MKKINNFEKLNDFEKLEAVYLNMGKKFWVIKVFYGFLRIFVDL